MTLKKLFHFVIGILLITSITNCKKDDDKNPEPTVPPITAKMTALVDGTQWSALSHRTSASIMNHTSFLYAVAPDSSNISFTFSEPITVNVIYPLNYQSPHVAIFNSSNTGSFSSWSSNTHSNNTGEFIITSMDTVNKRISGTFHFKGWRSADNTFKTITDGVFSDVTYITSTPTGGVNEFSVKVDNVEFNPTIINGYASNTELILIATNNTGERSVTLSMPANITTGVHQINSFFTGPIFGLYDHDSSIQSGSTNGTLTITTHNTSTKKITGTFNFNAEVFNAPPPTVIYNLTAGSFSVVYE